MSDYIDKYLNYLLYQKKYSSNTVLGYYEDLLFFKDYLEVNNYYFLEVSYEIIREFYNYMDKQKYSKNTISRKISSLRSFYIIMSLRNYLRPVLWIIYMVLEIDLF